MEVTVRRQVVRRPPARRHRRLAATLALLLVLAAAVVGAVWPSGPALAHAELLEVSPADGQVVPEPPVEAVLRFSEPVSLTGGSARVLDDTGQAVSAEPRPDGADIVVPVGGLGDGTYTVTWSVISTDSHRISGATVFHVGVPSAEGPVATDGDGAGWGVRAGAALLSALGYAGALVAVGGWWFSVLVGRRDDERWSMVVDRSAVLAAASLVAAVPLRIARLGGGLDALRDGDLLGESLRGPIGVSTAVTASALLAMTAFVGVAAGAGTHRWYGAVAAGLGFVALAGFTVEGHTRSQEPLAAMVGLDLVHLAAAALWLGGIAGLVTAFRSGAGGAELARLVARFSGYAVVAVLAVVGAGVGLAILVLPSPDDLVTTGYGLALIAKALLVVPVIAMGWYNRRRLVPAFDAGTGTAGAAAAPVSPFDTVTDGSPGSIGLTGSARRLYRIVVAELALLLAVVGVTAVLVARSPVSSSASQAAPTATQTPDAVVLDLSAGAGTAAVTVAPARAGVNELRVVLTDPAGRPLDPVETPTIELTEPDQQIGPLRPVVHPFGDGEYHVIADIPLAGTWQLDLSVRMTEFDLATATTTIDVE